MCGYLIHSFGKEQEKTLYGKILQILFFQMNLKIKQSTPDPNYVGRESKQEEEDSAMLEQLPVNLPNLASKVSAGNCVVVVK